MRDGLQYAVILAAIGFGMFLLGRVLPKVWFSGDRFPFRAFSFERDGRIYQVLGVARWKERLPDMSVLLPFLMPSKRLSGRPGLAELEGMIRETCVAEWTHGLLCVIGLVCAFFWRRIGRVLSVLFALGNLPYVIIQRYNRPRLSRLLRGMAARAGTPC